MSQTKITVVGKLRFSEEGGLQCSVLTAERPDTIPTAVFAALWQGLTDKSQLQVGDLVVHLDHGICVFGGLKQLGAGQGTREFLELRYAGDNTLFVPLDRLHLVRIHQRPRPPSLAELGGGGPKQPETYWLEPVPHAYEWPAIGRFPSLPAEMNANAMATWRNACDAYLDALHSDQTYREAARELFEPVSAGGSNTERNIQLLCESCNRSKGSTI